MKRTTAILLTILILTSFFTPTALRQAAAAEGSIDVRSAAALGLIAEEAAQNENATVSRGQFFNSIAILMNLSGGGENVFSDLTADNPYYDAVTALYNTGYISGYADGTVRTGEKISVSTAVRLLTYAVGYKNMIDAGRSVFDAALDADICNISTAYDNADLTVKKAATLLINAGNALCVEESGFSGEEADYAYGSETVFEKYMGIHRTEALVTANSFTYLNKKGYLSEGQVEIGGKILAEGESDAGSLIGCIAVAYYLDDEIDPLNTVLFACASEKNKITEVKAKDSLGYQGGYFSWYEGDKVQKTSLDLSSVDMIYNSSSVMALSETDFLFDSGSVKLIDNTQDGRYDVVMINSYQTCIVDSVDVDEEIIYGKYGVSYNLDSAENVVLKDKNGVQVFPIELVEWDVLSVAQSRDGKNLNIIYVADTVEGRVSSCEEGDKLRLTIEDAAYDVSDFAQNHFAADLAGIIGKEASFGFDIDGQLAYLKTADFTDGKYGFVRKWGKDGALSQKVSVKLVDEKGDTRIFELADRVKLNGERKTVKDNPDLFISLGSGLLLYEENEDGKIVSVDTPYSLDVDGNISGLGTEESATDSLCMFYDGYKKNAQTGLWDDNEQLKYISSTNVFGYKVAVNSDAKLFTVPRDGENADDTDYQVYNIKDALINKRFYYVRAYKTDINNPAADVVVRYVDETAASSKLEGTEDIAVISKIITVINEDGEENNKVTVMVRGGSKKEYITQNSEVLSSVTLNGSAYTPKIGDTVRLAMNVEGEINGIVMVYSAEKDVLEGGGNEIGAEYNTFHTEKADVYSVTRGHFTTTSTTLEAGKTYTVSALENYRIRPVTSYHIIIYDAAEKTVRSGNASALIGFTDSGGRDCSRVIINDNDGKGRVMIIYK